MMLHPFVDGHLIDGDTFFLIGDDIVSGIIFPDLLHHEFPFHFIQMITHSLWDVHKPPKPINRSKSIKKIQLKYLTISPVPSAQCLITEIKQLGH